jgi:DGQHR domain-containing protein
MVNKTYFGCRVAQRGKGNGVEFVVFVANTKDVMKWAGIRRVGEHEKGTQRIITESRVRAIKRFLDSDKNNTIPVGIVVAFGRDAARFESFQSMINTCIPEVDTRNRVSDKVDWGTLSFQFNPDSESYERPALIVDGQHRVFGMSEVQDEDIPILIVALIDSTPEEQAFQFVVINNKAAKVPTENVKAILASFDEPSLQSRLLDAGVSYGNVSSTLRDINEQEESPFRKLLIWPLSDKKEGRIQLTTIETCLRYIRNEFKLEEEDTLKEMFLAIWRSATKKFDDLWLKNDKFMSKVNIISVNDYIVDRLAFAWEGDLLDINQPKSVETQTTSILGLIPPDFWLRDWNFGIQDNTLIRKTIREDLNAIGKNIKRKKRWDKGLKMVPSFGEDEEDDD